MERLLVRKIRRKGELMIGNIKNPFTLLFKKQNIIKDALLPESTLDSVGKAWGLTRERVRQLIVEATGQGYKDIKIKLRIDSDKFCCPVCGGKLDPRNKNIYCHTQCYGISIRFDLEHPNNCKYSKCGKIFFRHRNWKAMKKDKGCNIGDYCCVKHYIEARLEKGKFVKANAEKLISKMGEKGK